MIIAVDTGATKTFVKAGSQKKESSKRHRFITPKDSAVYVDVLIELLTKEYELEKVTAISIGVPGLVENRQVTYCWNLPWQDFDLIAALEKKLPFKIPIFLQNDANLAGLAEIHALAQLPGVGLYLTVSTGVGTGVIVNGQIDPILQRVEGGQIILEYDGVLREWEKFASGRAIYETYGKYAHDIDPHDSRTWEAIGDKISRGLLVLIPIIQPEIIVIGGSIGTFFAHFHSALHAITRERLAPGFKMPQLTQAAHPQEAVLYGCNIYANQVTS